MFFFIQQNTDLIRLERRISLEIEFVLPDNQSFSVIVRLAAHLSPKSRNALKG